LEELYNSKIEKKKILSDIRNKQVEKDKFLKLSDFIEYLTDFYMSLKLDYNMLEDEIEKIKY
jgi:hypothetical protein